MHSLHFLLQLQEPVHEGLCGGWAPRDIDINGDNPVASPDYSITVVIISSSIGTAAHAYNPPRLWHLVIDFSECWGHFICQSSSNDNNISLTGGGSEHNSVPVHVISRGSYVHHFHCTAGKSKGEWPQGTLRNILDYTFQILFFTNLSAPVDQIVNPCKSIFHLVLLEVNFERRISMWRSSVRNGWGPLILCGGDTNIVLVGHLDVIDRSCVGRPNP